jgi:Tol biopolymer transport system component
LATCSGLAAPGKLPEILHQDDVASSLINLHVREPSPVRRETRLIARRNENEHNHFPIWSVDGRWIYSIDVRGGASWSPDGNWTVVRGIEEGRPGLFKVPVDGGKPIRLTTGVASNPVWSPIADLIA